MNLHQLPALNKVRQILKEREAPARLTFVDKEHSQAYWELKNLYHDQQEKRRVELQQFNKQFNFYQ